jgi:hypothetical protein
VNYQKEAELQSEKNNKTHRLNEQTKLSQLSQENSDKI